MKKKESFKLFIWIVFITMVIGYPIYSVFAVPLTIENNVSTTNLCSTIHPNLVGNSGKWFANKSDANKYGRQAVASEDYDKLGGDVYGYECWSCPNCEKWTVNFYYRNSTTTTTQPETTKKVTTTAKKQTVTPSKKETTNKEESTKVSSTDTSNTTVHTHTWDAGKITTAPTCTTTGIKTYTCTSCGSTRNENIDKIEHDYDCEIKQATCTEDGYTKYTCKYCGYSYQYITEYAIGHIYEYISNGDGTHYQHCTRCGYKTMNQECIKINNGSAYVCRYCDYVFPRRITTTLESTGTETTSTKETTNKEESTKVSSTDTSNTTIHTHTWDAGKITTAPTCTTTGIKTYTCTSCGATRTENIYKTEHHYNKVVIPATSTNEGYTIYECNNCHYSYITGYTKKLEEPQTSSKNNITTAATTKPSITKEQRTYESIEKTSYKKVANTKPKNTSIKKLKKGKKAIVVNWKKVSCIKGYQIQVATDKKFKKNAKTVVVKKQKTTTVTIKKLKSKKKYYVRIRTYKITNNKKVYSSWSKTKSITTK